MASTDRREALRAAVLKVLPVDPHDGEAVLAITKNDEPSALGQPLGIDMCWGDPGVLADTIVDAVTAIADEDVTIQWGARCLNNRCAAAGSIYHRRNSREKVEQSMAQAEDGHFELVRRKIWRGDWEAVADV